MDTRIHITQGEFATGTDPTCIISTLLGSCVSCCLWDPHAGVGGMNHILLAQNNSDDQTRALLGINAMEVLINSLIKLGAQRNRLQAKAFGGARMLSGLSDIGKQNAEFTTGFLSKEGIPLSHASLGGTRARNVRFWPATGRALQKLTDARVRLVETVPAPDIGAGVELF